MPGFTEEQVEEMVQEAVVKTEKSFGGTFKRLKSENEELALKYEADLAEYDSAKKEMAEKINELESKIEESKKHVSELAVKGELQKQLREKGPLPEKFIDFGEIDYSDDPEILCANVAKSIENGRKNLEKVLQDIGIPLPRYQQTTVNPTNPPSRDTQTAQNLKNAATQEVLQDMVTRGLIR